ncbi:MoaD/ThiS family protein [Xanthomonas euvesicatoria]|uniref:MoaD/ThiS family protein n=1 Tax=Xanthomonas euvesicatoria TaxID=456327 RepID=UPI001C48AB54|nr:MoaD/ThiS family protein [Xanthomonas euvesicatoria]
MKISVRLFGALSDYATGQPLEFELADGQCMADLRAVLQEHLVAAVPGFRPALLRCSAFADSRQILHERDPLPADGKVAVLPPVSGG